MSTKEIESDYIFTRQIKIFVVIWREDELQREPGYNPFGKNINSFKKKKSSKIVRLCNCIPLTPTLPFDSISEIPIKQNIYKSVETVVLAEVF